MIEYHIDFTELRDKGPLLRARYVLARHHLVQAMKDSTAAAEGSVTGRVPVGITGNARKSIGSRVYQSVSKTVGRVTTSMRAPSIYIFVLNAGRQAGKRQPPSEKLVPWVIERGLATGNAARRLAFVLARSIKRKGIKALNFMAEALNSNKGAIDRFHAQAVEMIIKDLSND